MSLSFSLSPRAGLTGVSRRPAPPIGVLAGAILAVVLGMGALAAVPGNVIASPSTVGVALLAALAAGLLVSLLTREGRRRRARTKETLAWIEKLHLCGSPARISDLTTSTNQSAVYPPQSPQVRSLQLHVRTLETVLEEQSTRLAQERRDVDARRKQDLQRVLVAVGALRGRVDDEADPKQVLDRVEAAVVRLTQPATAARPALPVRRLHVDGADRRAPGRLDEPPVHSPHPAPSEAESAPDVAVGHGQPVNLPTPTLAAGDVVLPVPAAHCAAPSRKRRLRRSVA